MAIATKMLVGLTFFAAMVIFMSQEEGSLLLFRFNTILSLFRQCTCNGMQSGKCKTNLI